ncbi:MAG: hypothetical protein ACI9WU_005317 [Myxococcota bacterium]|jgi:hypothetical protein
MRSIGTLLGHITLALGLIIGLAAPTAAQTDPGGQVRLTLEQYEQLMITAQNRAGGPSVTWGRASMSAELPSEEGARFLTVNLVAQAKLVGDGIGRIVILPGDVVIEQVTLNGSPAALQLSDGAHVALVPKGTGAVSLSVRYLVPLRPGSSGRSALIPVPPIPGATLSIAGGRGRVEIWPGGRITTSGDNITATIPSTPAIAVRIDDGSGGARIRRADYALVVDDSGDGAVITARFEVHSAGAKAKIRLVPESVPLVAVTEDDKPLVSRVQDGWHVVDLAGRGTHEVVARMRVAVDRDEGQPRVELFLDRAPITRVSASIAGKREVTFDPAVPVTTTVEGETEETQRTLAEAFLPPSNSIVVGWTESRPEPEKLVRVNTETYQLISVEEGVVRSKVQIRYEILRGSIRELQIGIPDGVVLYKVSGDGVDDWRTFAAEDGKPRRVEVTLGRERSGSYHLTLELEQVVAKTEGAPLAVPVIRPLSAFRETGVVALFDGKKVGFAPAKPAGYTPVGQDALPVDIQTGLKRTVSQAFKHIGAPGGIASKVAAALAKEVLYDARTTALYAVKEGAILANATVQVEVKSGKSDRIVLTFPEEVTILAVIAPSLSKKGVLEGFDAGPGRKAYELRFSQALEGTIEAHLEFELIQADEGRGTFRLPDVRVHGAEVEEGSFGLTAEIGIEVQEAAADKLRKVDIAELPDSVRRRAVGQSEILLGYTYAHTPWSLDLDVKRHETVETLEAMVTGAWLETTVFEDGHVVTRALYDVKNVDRQFLRLTLPGSPKVWSVTLNGSPIKAVSDDAGAVAVPLRKGRTARIAVVYQSAQDALGGLGGLDLTAPKSDVLVTDLQWVVRIPTKFALHNVDTDMQVGDGYDYRAPSEMGSELPVALRSAADVRVLLFTLPVQEPSEAAATVSFSYVSRPGDWLGSALWIIGLVLLLLLAFRRAARRGMGAIGWFMLLAGVGGMAAKIVGWGADDTEVTFAIVALVIASLVGWRAGRPAKKGADDSPEVS